MLNKKRKFDEKSNSSESSMGRIEDFRLDDVDEKPKTKKRKKKGDKNTNVDNYTKKDEQKEKSNLKSLFNNVSSHFQSNIVRKNIFLNLNIRG